MTKAVETAVFGATIRQIVDANDGSGCAAQVECVAAVTWAVYREHYDSRDDVVWYSCCDHLTSVAVEAIDFDESDED